MNFYYDDYEEAEINNSKFNFLNNINKKKIIMWGLFILVIIFLFIFFSPSSRYGRIEVKMVDAARKYVKDNYINVNHEVYLDAKTINFDLNNKCSNISGVFYNGNDYIPHLYCNDYESNVTNNNAATIKLNGKSTIILIKGTYFIDPGYTCKNNVNIIGEVGNEEGVYTLYYYDTYTNDAVTRKVVVIDNSELLGDVPFISLNGNDVVHVFKGEKYYDEGVVATDKNDGNITDKVVISGNVDTNNYGQYLLVYSITNKKGLTNNVSRMVNVANRDMSLNADFLVSPLTIVNTNVTISLKITGNDFDYVLLPDNTKSTSNYINYKAEKNGTYIFTIYDRAGRALRKEVKITNIDKDLPLATCDAVVYNGYTDIVVNSLSVKNISSYEYKINGLSHKSISSTYRYSDGVVNSASVVLNNISGNKNEINCNITDYNTWMVDYSRSIVFIKSDTSNDIIKKYALGDYLMGVVYKELIDVDFNNLTNEQLSNLFKTYFILKKAEVFKKGGYNISNKQIIFNIDNSDYCDVYNGCKLVSKNNKSFYLANDIEYNVDSVLSSKDKLSDNIINLMKNAYNETKKYVIISGGYNDLLKRYTEDFNLNSSLKEIIMNGILNNNPYDYLIKSIFGAYQIYNIDLYANKYNESNKTYFWPIGSSYATNGMYANTPDSVSIVHNYGASIADNKIYDYMAIKGECNKTNVISAWNGVVVYVGYDANYGNHVIIDHGNGVKFMYGSLNKSSITVGVGASIRKGELIGRVDKVGNGCMLYVKATYNDITEDPLNYISSTNPRPTNGESIYYVAGGTVKESVCLTLVASGFSNTASAALMANIQRESNFNLKELGDNGTSYGLLQWHGERWTNMKKHCGSNIDTVECQLDFLLYELNNYKKSSKDYIYGNYSTYDSAYWFCRKFLMPASAETTCAARANIAVNTYDQYVLNGCK